MTREEFIQRAVIAMLGNPKLMTRTNDDTFSEIIELAQNIADNLESVPVEFDYENHLEEIEKAIEGIYESIDDFHSTYRINS